MNGILCSVNVAIMVLRASGRVLYSMLGSGGEEELPCLEAGV